MIPCPVLLLLLLVLPTSISFLNLDPYFSPTLWLLQHYRKKTIWTKWAVRLAWLSMEKVVRDWSIGKIITSQGLYSIIIMCYKTANQIIKELCGLVWWAGFVLLGLHQDSGGMRQLFSDVMSDTWTLSIFFFQTSCSQAFKFFQKNFNCVFSTNQRMHIYYIVCVCNNYNTEFAIKTLGWKVVEMKVYYILCHNVYNVVLIMQVCK